MSEFSESAKPSPSGPAVTPNNQPGLLSRPIVLGLSIPWLVGLAAVLGAVCWYLFAPPPGSTVNQLAFDDGGGMQRVTAPELHRVAASEQFSSPMVAQSSPDLSVLQEQITGLIKGLRADGAANTEAIVRLADTTKTVMSALGAVQQQLVEAQAQIAMLSARVPMSDARTPMAPPQTPVVISRNAKVAVPVRSSPPDMYLSSIQNGMAWVLWQDKTWAVKAGDTLGPVTITAIDAQQRQVHTSAGTLK